MAKRHEYRNLIVNEICAPAQGLANLLDRVVLAAQVIIGVAAVLILGGVGFHIYQGAKALLLIAK